MTQENEGALNRIDHNGQIHNIVSVGHHVVEQVTAECKKNLWKKIC